VSEQASTQPDSEKDVYPPDADFGRQAARDEERVDEMAERGEAPEDTSGDMTVDAGHAPRAASKAEPAQTSTGGSPADRDDETDESSEDSFPASDPPSSTGSTASG
jgi:hypothetical protein